MAESKKDRDPRNKDEFSSFSEDPTSKKVRDFLRDDPVSHIVFNALWRLALYSKFLTTQEGREALKDPLSRRFLFDRERRIGLLENSIINPELYHPNRAGTSLQISSAAAGRYAGFDFRRPKEFRLQDQVYNRQIYNGRLYVFALDEVKGNPQWLHTPTNLFDIFDLAHALCFDCHPLDQAIEQGYLRETTYGAAYRKTGHYEKYRLALLHSGINDKPVYVVTPKGNGLVGLAPDMGEKVKKPKTIPECKPVFET